MADVVWTPGRPEEVFPLAFDKWLKDVESALYELLRRFAPEIEAWMKNNALWQDITTNARGSLAAEAEQLIAEAALHVMGGMDYSIYLETANQGRYAILKPAVEFFAPQIWAAVQELLR